MKISRSKSFSLPFRSIFRHGQGTSPRSGTRARGASTPSIQKNRKQILAFKSLDGHCMNRLASSRHQDCPALYDSELSCFTHVWSST